MRILKYECKKILNIKMLILIFLFTYLFYDMFTILLVHPNDNQACIAQNDLADALDDNYGTSLSYEDFYALEEVLQSQIVKLDSLVKESTVLQKAGITNYEELKEVGTESVDNEILNEMNRITFESGIRETFLKQHIEKLYEMMEIHPVVGVEPGKEIEAANTFLSHKIEHEYSNDAVNRVADVIKENKLSLIPNSVMFHLENDLPRFGILLVISCLILILPYQIKEKLAGVNTLFATTNTGRRIWDKRFCSTMISCLFMCILQFIILCGILARANILKYWNYPINGNGDDFYWFNMGLGDYIIINVLMYSILTLGISTVFYFISRKSMNYIVAIAVGVPVAIGFSVLIMELRNSFLAVTKSIGYNLVCPTIFVVIILGIAIAIICCLKRWDQRRDIFI